MKKVLFIAVFALALAGCDDPKAARRALESAGFTDIETQGYAFWGCGEKDTFKTRFSARNPKGQLVTGVVCNGWFKGATVRFD